MTAREIQDELQISYAADSPPRSAVNMIIFAARTMRRKWKFLFCAMLLMLRGLY